MRPNANSRRSRGRGGRKSGNPRNQTFDSNGPGARVRGNASQIFEKYQQLARDAASSGDRVGAENFLQHAEHYYRLMSANGTRPEQRNNDDRSAEERSADERADEEEAKADDNADEALVENVSARSYDTDADDRAELDEALGAKRGNGKGNGANGRRRRRATNDDDDGAGNTAAAGDDSDDEGEAASA